MKNKFFNLKSVLLIIALLFGFLYFNLLFKEEMTLVDCKTDVQTIYGENDSSVAKIEVCNKNIVKIDDNITPYTDPVISADGMYAYYTKEKYPDKIDSSNPYAGIIREIVKYDLKANKIESSFSLSEVESQNPGFTGSKNAGLNNIRVSQSDNNLVAVNFGYLLEKDSMSDVIVVDFSKNKSVVLKQKGILKDIYGLDSVLIEYPDVSKQQLPPNVDTFYNISKIVQFSL